MEPTKNKHLSQQTDTYPTLCLQPLNGSLRLKEERLVLEKELNTQRDNHTKDEREKKEALKRLEDDAKSDTREIEKLTKDLSKLCMSPKHLQKKNGTERPTSVALRRVFLSLDPGLIFCRHSWIESSQDQSSKSFARSPNA